MRIVAGKWRGRHIAAPDTLDTRPVLDRAKVVLFDILGHLLAQPGVLPPIAVLDLFAGSGALGLEALSRGARYCLFVEQGSRIAEILRKNLDTLEIIQEAEVLQADVTGLSIRPPPPPADSPDEPARYGLVFVDPPFRMLAGPRPMSALRGLLRVIARDRLVAPEAIIVVRHAVQHDGGPDLSPLIEQQRRDVGGMTLRFMLRPAGDVD